MAQTPEPAKPGRRRRAATAPAQSSLEDPGYGQIGCFLAMPSIVVGNLLGLLAVLVTGRPVPIVGVAAFASAAAVALGFVVGSGAGYLFDRIPATRPHAFNLGLGVVAIAPAIVAFAIWLWALASDSISEESLLGASAVIAAIVVFGPFALMLLALIRRLWRDSGPE